MAGPLRYDGKVVLVTGAGGGLGREYALKFAERGAKVVVNDLGGDIKGGGKSSKSADKVVEEIKAKGGIAVANYDSVEDGEKVVQTALDNFGRIDILINNAGILRDRSFARTSDGDWDIIQRVHLRGSFMVSRAAWPHMKDNKYGKIIMTTSAAGIYGNFGQANYSAAKLGLLGLGQTLAIEGRKYNISCNIIAPIAGSRLTETVMPEDMLTALKPDYVMPVVLWLCHEDCPASGELFEVGGGWVSKLRWQRTQGAMLRGKGKLVTPEAVRDNWEKITDFTDPYYPQTIGESGGYMYQLHLQAEEEAKANPTSARIKLNPTAASKINPDNAVGAVIPEFSFTYDERDVMLYALGVGVSTKQEHHLKFLFEMNEEFSVLPSFAVLPWFHGGNLMGVEGLQIDPTKILHGEQYLELYKPLPTSGTLKSKGTVVDVLDKGSGAVIIVDVISYDEDGEKIAFNQISTFIQKAGGFGGKRSSDKAKQPVNPPNRAPDASVKEQTGIDQAAVYRLSGDRNPLHIDPQFAAMGGFPTPILHGLCSFGYAVRHVLQQYADSDVTKFKAVKVRFSKPVLPGQTIQTDMWQEGSRIHFQCKVAETGATSMSGCYVDLVSAPTLTANPTAATITPVCETDVLMKIAAGRISTQPELTKQVNAIFQFNVMKNKKEVSQWVIDMKKVPAEVYQGECKNGKPGVTVAMEDSHIMDMATGKLAGPQAFLSGKMKLKGNIMLAQKLGTIFMEKAKL